MHVLSRLLFAAAILAALSRPAAGQGAAIATDVGAASASAMAASTGSDNVPPASSPAPQVSSADHTPMATGGQTLAEPAPAAPAAPGEERVTAGPTLSAATVGLRANAAREDLTEQQLAQRAAHHGGPGTSVALMIVGGVAFIAGLIIGGGAGTAVAIAGAAVGLYGLYLYLQ
jgi:hypothetical protein